MNSKIATPGPFSKYHDNAPFGSGLMARFGEAYQICVPRTLPNM